MKPEVDEAIWRAIAEVARQYDDDRPGFGDTFIEALHDAFAHLVSFPESAMVWPDMPPAVPPIRRFTLAKFPYVVGYQAFADRVRVIAVADARRRPGYWR